MEEIEMRKRVGRPKKLSKAASKTISVELDKYEEIAAEAEKQGISFFEFVSELYLIYARDDNREILNALRELRETKAELSRLKRENDELNEKIAKIHLKGKKNIYQNMDKDLMISEARDKMGEMRPLFETDIRLCTHGELNKEILKNRRELFRARKTEYMRIKSRIESAGIHDIDAEISAFDTLISNAQKALGISTGDL